MVHQKLSLQKTYSLLCDVIYAWPLLVDNWKCHWPDYDYDSQILMIYVKDGMVLNRTSSVPNSVLRYFFMNYML